MIQSDFLSLCLQLDTADTEEDLKRICRDFCIKIDFEYYLIGIISCSISLNSPRLSIVTNYPENWLKTYLDENMSKDDPIMHYCLENTLPIRWNELIKMDRYINPTGIQIMEKAAKVGLCSGISIPLKSPSRETAIFSVSTTKNTANVDDRINNVITFIDSFGVRLYENFCRIRTKSDNNQTTTPRETECLLWACEGKTTWEISQIIGVSERTITFHLNSVTKKLDAANRQHAVAKAITNGLIKPVL